MLNYRQRNSARSTVDGSNKALQLMHVQSQLGPWFAKEEAEFALPPPLQHGPIHFLHTVSEMITTAYTSTKMMKDSLILLTYGTYYLQDHYDPLRSNTMLLQKDRQRQQLRQEWKTKALGIQSRWRTQRFHTHRLSPLRLESIMLPDIPDHENHRIHNVPIEMNPTELHTQIELYRITLEKRMEMTRLEHIKHQEHARKEHQMMLERRKRLARQKRKHYETICQRWQVLTRRVLQLDYERELSHREQVQESNVVIAIHRVVEQIVHQAITRVVLNMIPTQRHLHIGLILCDVHFGITYMSFYQRFFDRLAHEQGLELEWTLFNCLQYHFPTRAQLHGFDGILIGGGPHTIQQNGHWRKHVIELLKEWIDEKRLILGGLGFGHVLLGQALGGTIGIKEWEDGWNIVAGQEHFGIRYIHGEYVESLDRNGLYVTRQSSHVTCFSTSHILSFDGNPECGTLVFDTLSELHDRQCHTIQKIQEEEEEEEEWKVQENKPRIKISDASVHVARLLLTHFASPHNKIRFKSPFEIIGIVHDDVKSCLESFQGIPSIYINVYITSDDHLVVIHPSLIQEPLDTLSTLRLKCKPNVPKLSRGLKQRLQPHDVSTHILTLSEALTILMKQNQDIKHIFLYFPQEESKTRTIPSMRLLWLGLLASFRMSKLESKQVVILSRQNRLLEYLRRKRPTWTFIKDCRHHFCRPQMGLYAHTADGILVDQISIVSDSIQENRVWIEQAHACGLQVYVQGSLRSKKSDMMDHIWLQLCGVNGMITVSPNVAIDAMEQIKSNSLIKQEVEHYHHPSIEIPRNQSDEEQHEDVLEEEYDSNDSVREKEIVKEMTRQWAEHGLMPSMVPLRPVQPRRSSQRREISTNRRSTMTSAKSEIKTEPMSSVIVLPTRPHARPVRRVSNID